VRTAPLLTRPQFTLTAISVGAVALPHLWRMPLMLALPIAALLVGRWLQRERNERRIPIWIKLPLVLLFPILIIVHYGNIFGREPGSALACAMLVLKVLETETPRDARAAVCFSAFVLMSAMLFDSSLMFTIALLAALSLLLAALRELEPRPTGTPPQTLASAWREGMRVSAIALLGAIPLALCVFLFFPRLGSPLWGAPTDSTARTGLGDRMAPGTIQELLIDDSPAFRVSFHGAAPPKKDLYWRGPVLSSFDGTAWSRPEYFGARDGRGDLQSSGPTTSYEITLEPSDRHWLLALEMPIKGPDDATRGADMTLVRQSAVDSLLRYEVTSATNFRLDTNISERQRQRMLELPRDVDPRSRQLAAGWRADAKNDDNAVIRSALDLFNQKFTYTLNAPLLARDSIDDFLFNTQRGFCEHYAAAFTFLMRAANIPARVVTGYQGGFYNSVGDYWVVRQSDAHAWSEVWLAGRGWVRVDPTAAVSPQRVELGSRAAAGESARWYQADWMQAVRNQFDLVNRVWNDAIVQFNVLRQQSLLTPFGVDKADYASLMIFLIGSSSLLLILFVWWVLRVPRVHGDALDQAYGRLRAKLSKAGLISKSADGPLTLAARVKSHQEITAVFSEYVRLRYACAVPELNEVRRFARAVASLRLAAPRRAQ
jgi:protein-glutamine gamma-glutamyltransferase